MLIECYGRRNSVSWSSATVSFIRPITMYPSSLHASLASQIRRQLSGSMSTLRYRCKSTRPPNTAVDERLTAAEDLRGLNEGHTAIRDDKLLPEMELVLPPAQATTVAFRPAKPVDCSTIFKYLRAHAQSEGHPDEFEITESDLIRDGFGDTPCFRCDVAEAYGENDVTCIIGYALYSVTYCAWKGRTLAWENRFIHPHYRDLGIGKAIFYQVCKTQFEQGCRRISGYLDASEADLLRWYENVGMDDLTRRYDFHIVSGLTKADTVMGKFVRDGHRGLSTKAMSNGISIQLV